SPSLRRTTEPAPLHASLYVRLSLPKGEGRVRVRNFQLFASTNPSPQSSPLQQGERRRKGHVCTIHPSRLQDANSLDRPRIHPSPSRQHLPQSHDLSPDRDQPR